MCPVTIGVCRRDVCPGDLIEAGDAVLYPSAFKQVEWDEYGKDEDRERYEDP